VRESEKPAPSLPDWSHIQPVRVEVDHLVVELTRSGFVGEQPSRVEEVVAGLLQDGRILGLPSATVKKPAST